jgi:6-phosphogluconolactonase
VTEASVVVHADAEVLAHAAAARLAVRLLDAQADRGSASVVLTGGGIAAKMYAALREAPVRDAVDWSHVHFWWGDERFVAAASPDRNERQAREALLDHIPVDKSLVHAMPASDGPDGDDPEAAAERYAAELASAARPGTARLPHFDVVLLGVGEDGHVASVFPEHPVVYETRPVSAVRGSPKPPPVRITLTLPALCTAEEVWLLAAGPGKADAVAMALAGGGGPVQVPASGVHGVERTFWLLDRSAAAHVGPKFRSLR